jgi:hypothetical protein
VLKHIRNINKKRRGAMIMDDTSFGNDYIDDDYSVYTE